MTEEEQKIFRLYGKVPNTKDLLQNKLKVSSTDPLSFSQSHNYQLGTQVFRQRRLCSFKGGQGLRRWRDLHWLAASFPREHSSSELAEPRKQRKQQFEWQQCTTRRPEREPCQGKQLLAPGDKHRRARGEEHGSNGKYW